MNKTYRNIWNAATQTWTAVAETAKSHSKGSARAALSTVVALVAFGAPLGAATAAEACTTADGQATTANTSDTCPLSTPAGAQSRAITPTATLDDAYIQVKPATTTGTAASASGSAAIAIGDAAVSNGSSTLAFGSAATATGDGSIAFGHLAHAAGIGGAIAVGNNALATGGTGATAIGNASTANGTSVLAIGSSATATNTGSMAFGRLAKATGIGGAIAIGNDTLATGGTGATAIGSNATASGTSVTAIGSSANATGTGAMALGRLTSATANFSTALGNQASTQAANAVAVGNLATVSTGATNSVAIGNSASVAANVTNAMALGTNSTATRNDTISVGSSTQQRQIVNMAAGTQGTDAVNVSQLSPVVSALGGGAAIDAASGAVTGPAYALANGGSQTTVGDALGALDGALTNANGNISKNATDIADLGTQVTTLDGRVTTNEANIAKNAADITTINNQLGDLSSGAIGLVRQSAAGADLTVGANTDGAAVIFAGTAGARKLTGIANGDVAAGSTDAVTGDQLNATNVNVAGLDQRVANNETSITQIRSDMNSGAIGLVQQDAATGAITVGAALGGASVNFAGSGGARTLSGVANGVNDDDAVTIAQLKATGLIDYTGKEIAAVAYDDISLGGVTFGGVGGTVLHNVAPGLIAAGSMDAVNGGQLHAMQQDFDSRFSGLDDRVAGLESGGLPVNPGNPGDGASEFDPGGSGDGSVQLGAGADASGSHGTAIGTGAGAAASNGTALGQGAIASGDNGTAIGQGANAGGNNGTAIGQGANASGNNAVALGAGSVADRDNAVSVGSAGNERQITNVAAGTAPTDAVNVQQMQNSVRSARQDAMGGVAAAMAVAGLPQSTQPGRTFVAMAGSTYGGEYGSALGVSYMTRDGKWTIKASANTSSRGTVGAVVGGGFYW